jgi:hypothetical protein
LSNLLPQLVVYSLRNTTDSLGEIAFLQNRWYGDQRQRRVHLKAPDGFISYRWSNNYQISSLTSQQVVVNPASDTAYYLKAEKLPGCFAYDTVRIKVNRSPVIDMGNDVQFCSGDSVTFAAGAGFSHYT